MYFLIAISYKVYFRQISNFSSVVHVACCVDGRGQLTDLNLEALLDLIQNFLILVRLNEGNRQSLSSKSAGTTDTMQVAVRLRRHVKVEDDVDFLNVDTTAKDLSGDQDAVLELLEALVDFDSLFLGNTSVDRLGRDSVFVEDLGKLDGVGN